MHTTSVCIHYFQPLWHSLTVLASWRFALNLLGIFVSIWSSDAAFNWQVPILGHTAGFEWFIQKTTTEHLPNCTWYGFITTSPSRTQTEREKKNTCKLGMYRRESKAEICLCVCVFDEMRHSSFLLNVPARVLSLCLQKISRSLDGLSEKGNKNGYCSKENRVTYSNIVLLCWAGGALSPFEDYLAPRYCTSVLLEFEIESVFLG